MADKMNSSDDNNTPVAEERAKKWSGLNGLILAGVFLLGAILPSEYRYFAPLLFLLPAVIKVINKMGQAAEIQTDSPQNPYSPPEMLNGSSSTEPYTCTPKDLKDPRRYKPIG